MSGAARLLARARSARSGAPRCSRRSWPTLRDQLARPSCRGPSRTAGPAARCPGRTSSILPSTILSQIFSGLPSPSPARGRRARSRSTISAGMSSRRHRQRVRRGDVHREVAHQRLELLGARHEVRLAVHLHQHADLAAHVDVAADRALACVSRPARFAAFAAPFARRMSTAASMSPPVSSSALLHSIIPAPVRSRSSFTCFAVISPLCPFHSLRSHRSVR